MANPDWTDPGDWEDDRKAAEMAEAFHPLANMGRRVGGEPNDEAEHFINCGACGQAIDCRDLNEVFRHETPDYQARRPS